MKVAEQFIVGKRVTFRLSDSDDGDDYTALVKKAKQNLLAVVISNKDKNNLQLDIGDNVHLYGETGGVAHLTCAKLVQNQSYPLIILDVFGDPEPLSALEPEPYESVPDDEPSHSPAPAMEIESIDDDSMVVVDEPLKAPVENEETKIDHEKLPEPSFIASDEVAPDDIDLITLETSNQVFAPENEENVESANFFGVWITRIESDTAKKIGEAILSGDMALPGASDANTMEGETSSAPAQKGSMEKLLDHVAYIEKVTEQIRQMVTGGVLNARHGGAGSVCVTLTTKNIRLVSDEPMTVGDYWLVTVDRPWKPGLYFTAVAIVDDCEEVNSMSVANLRFSAIHADAASSITKYHDHSNEFLKMLKAI